jgi:membrane-associated phospholipid phosphatase
MRGLLIALGACALLILAAVYFADDPVARFVHTLPWASTLRSPALGWPVLIALSCVTVLAGAAQTASRHPSRKLMEILIVASFSLTWSDCINEFILKRLFGRKTPDDFLRDGIDAFHWLQGTPISSFPSGHAVQIASVGIVFLMAYPRQRAAWLALMGLGLMALVLGNWHFASDVIAGTAVGAVGAVATLSLWRAKADGPDGPNIQQF